MDTPVVDERRWRAHRQAVSAVKVWGDEAVVYDARRARTSLLSAAAWAVFDTLDEIEDSSTADILKRLGEGTEASAGEMRTLRDILDSLQECGLAESRAP